jgi:hypothetical protein
MFFINDVYAGSGAAQNIVGNMSGSSITKSQARYVRESLEETKTTKGTSAANQTIEYLRAQSENKHIRYKALYHKVTSSSLLAMTKARQKIQRVEQHKKEEGKKTMNNTASVVAEDSIDDITKSANDTGDVDKTKDAGKINNSDSENENDDGTYVHPELRDHNAGSTYWQQIRSASKRKRKPNKKYVDEDLLNDMTSHSVSSESTETTEDGTEISSPVDLDKNSDKLVLGEVLVSVSESRALKIGQKVLLAVAWCREDERRLFELFAEVLMARSGWNLFFHNARVSPRRCADSPILKN